MTDFINRQWNYNLTTPWVSSWDNDISKVFPANLTQFITERQKKMQDELASMAIWVREHSLEKPKET